VFVPPGVSGTLVPLDSALVLQVLDGVVVALTVRSDTGAFCRVQKGEAERRVPGRNVCAPWRSACICWAASSSDRPSSAVRYITPLPLLVGVPPASAPATNRACTLRKGISSLETGVAAVRQAYNGRPVVPRCRLLGFLFGGVGLGLHLYSLPWVWLPHRCQAAPGCHSL